MLMNWLTAFAEEAATTTEAATETPVAAGGGMISMIIMLAVMFLIMYFLMIRPQKKKEKAVKNMLDALKPGDRICTIGGFYGTIKSIKDNDIVLTLGADQNVVVIARWAVRSVENVAQENDAEPEI